MPAYLSMRALPELVEAAVRTQNAAVADDALSRLETWTQAGGTDWGLGTEARCRALLSEGAVADEHYREALERLGRTRLRPEVARTHLLYGEWLRRRQRHRDAREQLAAAVEMFDDIGMEAFAGRARRELHAAGGTARRRASAIAVELTAQEAQIARLAGEGLSNPEIATPLFLSPRTVQYHLGKVFTKLGVTSRAQLSRTVSGLRYARRLATGLAGPAQPAGGRNWLVRRFSRGSPGKKMTSSNVQSTEKKGASSHDRCHRTANERNRSPAISRRRPRRSDHRPAAADRGDTLARERPSKTTRRVCSWRRCRRSPATGQATTTSEGSKHG